MSALEIGYAAFPVLLILIALRAPIGLAMLLVGGFGFYFVLGSPNMILAKMKSETYGVFSNYSLSVIPLFLLMGELAARSGLSARLFSASAAVFGHLRGGLPMSAIGACAGFGAICGSSLATAAAMGRVALPEMHRYGHSRPFSAAVIAAGGTLGILIPPSVILVIYAILIEQNIQKLFAAAIVPGLIAVVGYFIAIKLYTLRHPEEAVQQDKAPVPERIAAIVAVWPILAIFVLVVGGIYWGFFTPTQAAAVGAVLTGAYALGSGELTREGLFESFYATAKTTGLIFFIILGAGVFNGFLAITRLPQELSNWASGSSLSPWVILAGVLVLYLILGCVMESLSMILLTIPVLFPVLSALDFGMSAEAMAIWFGILALTVVELGLITPPVGLNLFILAGMDDDLSPSEVYGPVLYFIAMDVLRVALIVAFPAIALLY